MTSNSSNKIIAMFCSIMIVIIMMTATATLINYLEGDILPDTSPWSFISNWQNISNIPYPTTQNET